MKLPKQLILASVATLIVSCGGGGSSVQSEMKSVMADITDVLEDVKDADSAEAAKSKLEPLMERMSKLTKEAAANPAESAKGMDADDVKAYTEVTTAYSTEISRVLSNPETGGKLADVLSMSN